MAATGRLVCVGLGMTLGAHLAPRARSCIEQADVVFAAVSDPVVELWLQQLHADVRSLQPYYAEGKSRHDTYAQMVAAILDQVRAGRSVCGAFYGHPGVFALAPHQAIEQARSEGFPAHMEPAIPAEDCLYADLGIDPGRHGCQHFEASQLLFYQRRIDPSAVLVLWQAGLVGDRSHRRYGTGPAYRQLLVERLQRDYPAGHPVTLYEAATLAIQPPRIEVVALADLAGAQLRLQTTLVLRPAMALQPDAVMLARLARLDAGQAAHDPASPSTHPATGVHHVECNPVP